MNEGLEAKVAAPCGPRRAVMNGTGSACRRSSTDALPENQDNIPEPF